LAILALLRRSDNRRVGGRQWAVGSKCKNAGADCRKAVYVDVDVHVDVHVHVDVDGFFDKEVPKSEYGIFAFTADYPLRTADSLFTSVEYSVA